jgi:hypothetical protein
VGGLVLLLFGALLFAHNLDLVNLRQYGRFWPAVPLGVGLFKLVGGGGRGDRAFGVALTLFGGSQLAKALGYWSPGPADMAALLLIGVGGWFIVRGLFGRPDVPPSPDTSDVISALAIMAGFERTSNARNFRGGDLAVVMGGCEIDLRQASMRAPATIDVFVMWGGIELRVPEDWTVDLQGTPLLAGFVDHTRPPSVATEKRLVIRGLALMGGVEIKN